MNELGNFMKLSVHFHEVILPKECLVHVANYGWLFDQDQTLANFRDHITSTITCNFEGLRMPQKLELWRTPLA